MRGRDVLFHILALTEDEEIGTIIEKLSGSDELLMGTPYLRPLCNRAWQEGHIKGRAEDIHLTRQ